MPSWYLLFQLEAVQVVKHSAVKVLRALQTLSRLCSQLAAQVARHRQVAYPPTQLRLPVEAFKPMHKFIPPCHYQGLLKDLPWGLAPRIPRECSATNLSEHLRAMCGDGVISAMVIAGHDIWRFVRHRA